MKLRNLLTIAILTLSFLIAGFGSNSVSNLHAASTRERWISETWWLHEALLFESTQEKPREFTQERLFEGFRFLEVYIWEVI